jgi:hypothetical protein
MKYGFVLALFLIGCSFQPPQLQAKRIWVMSEMNHADFTVKEDNGTSELYVMQFCYYDAPVAMWQGLYADIVVAWDSTTYARGCYRVLKITALN